MAGFDKKLLEELSFPRTREGHAIGLKTIGLLIQRGISEEDIEKGLKALVKSPEPSKVQTNLPAEIVGEMIAFMEDLRSKNLFWEEAAQPAPWKVWGKDFIDEASLAQMNDACRLPVSAAGALMPDAHKGYGLPIGGVLAVRNAVIPFAVGVDIACRMRISILDLTPEEFEKDRRRFGEALIKGTRFGAGAMYYPDELKHHPVMDEDWDVSPVTRIFKKKAHSQLGTSGAGNHFAEFGYLTVFEDIDEPSLKVKAGKYIALLTHSGSRGTGLEVANHYSRLASSLHPEIPKELEHLAWLSLDSPEGQEYWNAMQLMGRYAAANHEIIHQEVLKLLKIKPIGFVENHHNFAWKETFNGEELIIHRKGATPAGEGVLGVIPGSMATPGFIVRGKGNPDSFNSCSHGAGRCLSRGQAFKTLTRSHMQKILKEKGITLISASLDESPEVYKDIEKVMAAQSDLVDLLARFDPKIVRMAEGSARFGKAKARKKEEQPISCGLDAGNDECIEKE